jgi:hypothetical protein
MKTSNKIYSFKIACLSIILLALLAAAPLTLAQNGTRLYFQPVESANGTVTIEVMAENVTDLYGLELRLKYDPAILEIQDSQADQQGTQIEAGALLPVNQGFVVANQANQAEGTILYAVTLLNPAPAVSGSGPVARLTFKRLQDAPSTLSVEQATLVSVNLQTIPAETTSLTLSLGLGLLVVGGFIVIGGLTKKTQPQVARGATPGSGRRPSAFKDSTLQKPSQPRQ